MRNDVTVATLMISDDPCVLVLDHPTDELYHLLKRNRTSFKLCLRCQELAYRHAGDRCIYSPFRAVYSEETRVSNLDSGNTITFIAYDNKRDAWLRTYADIDDLRADYVLYGGYR